MMTRRGQKGVRSALVLAAILVGSAVSAFAGPLPAPEAKQEAEIRAVLDAQTAAWNQGDISGFMSGYWKSDETIFVGANGVLRGWQTLLGRYEREFPNREAMGKLSFSNLEVHSECREAAYAIGEYHVQRTGGELSGIFTLEFRKFPEGWRIVMDHSTPYAKPNPANR
ncbi:MAG TPA: DUF4440 domain-containing protein [Verrucomicrobiae bacterium]|nr:DUF4440 domain-containing protein [Verrucomicrobiae bacterium]